MEVESTLAKERKGLRTQKVGWLNHIDSTLFLSLKGDQFSIYSVHKMLHFHIHPKEPDKQSSEKETILRVVWNSFTIHVELDKSNFTLQQRLVYFLQFFQVTSYFNPYLNLDYGPRNRSIFFAHSNPRVNILYTLL